MIPDRGLKVGVPFGVVMALIGSLCLKCGERGRDKKADLAVCRSITVGMSEEEVLKRMGGRHKRFELTGAQEGKHKLIFEGPPSASANPQLVVDSRSNVVETVFCGE